MAGRTLLAGALLAGLTGAAQADTLRASEPGSFTDFFYEAGYASHLGEDAVGDPYIEFRHEDVILPLWFYDCVDNAACQSVQFYYAYALDAPIAPEKLNEWNGEERRFTRAYMIEDGTLRLEMDVFTGQDGISATDFQSLLSLWLDRLDEFERFIGW